MEGFLSGTSDRERPASVGDARDAGLFPELGRSPGEGNGNTLQYSSLKNSMDKRSLVDSLVHGVTESQKRLRERERERELMEDFGGRKIDCH